MRRVILLDADIPIFRYSAVNQRDIVWSEGDESVAVNPPFEMVADQVDAHIEELADTLEADRIIICLSEPVREKNWRKGILPTYKDNRKDTKSPEYRQKLSDYLEEHYECYKKPTLEGDDVMGILATNPDIVKGKKVIVSQDKDMKTIPTRIFKGKSVNWLFNPDKDKKPRKVTESEADWFWMMQTLMGDTTDGYSGCPWVGEKKARDALGEPQDGHLSLWWDLVVDTYENATRKGENLGLGIEDALVQARVARICRAEDYDFNKQEAIPWTP